MQKTDLLDPDKITANLKTKLIGKKVLVYNSTSSTNDVAAEYAKSKKNDGLAVFAEQQTKGRGRAEARWVSRPADSILCSVVLTRCKLNPELLSLACAVAVAETIANNAKVKWPNDIILNGKKIAGILLESKANDRSTAYILGIGINCHQKKKTFPAELRKTATSIDIETKTICDRISIARRLLTTLEHWLEAAQAGTMKVTNRWRRLSIQLGHRITVVFNGKKFTGNCIGIDPQKGLVLQLETGGVRFFDAAHTTIAK